MRLTISVVFLFGFVGVVFSKSVAKTISLESLDHPTISIIGGTPAQTGDFPFMASLIFPLNATIARLCGGTLIASSYILTAAHCVDGLPINGTSGYVFINSLALSGGGNGSITRRVSTYVAHQQFFMNSTSVVSTSSSPSSFANYTYVNDIALLVLNLPVTTAENITFVNLPTDPSATTIKPATTTTPKPTTTTTPKPTTSTKPPTTTTKPTTKPATTLKPITVTTKAPVCSCTCAPPALVNGLTTKKPIARRSRAFSTYSNASAIITGWGVTNSGSTSPVLLKANVTIYDNSFCTSEWHNQFDGTKQLCAAQTNTATCFGDSGGPILVNGNVQVGVVSFVSGNGCADPAHVPVFTRVSAFLGWIADTMASNPPPAAGK